MQPLDKIKACYDVTAENYAEEFIGELSKKHFDRFLLSEFAAVNKGKGTFADLGCGPGQTTKFLFDCGIKDIIGIDLSGEMIKAAHKFFPDIKFETGNFYSLDYPSNYFGAAIAFYAIVNLSYEQVKIAFDEIYRVLKRHGHFLFSFHIGDELIHVEKFLEKDTDIDFYFFQTEKIIDLLDHSGFEIVNAIERYPYKNAEYPSKRAYIWAGKK